AHEGRVGGRLMVGSGRRARAAIPRWRVRRGVQQLGDRTCWRCGEPAALRARGGTGGARVLGADAESLVPGGAASAHAGGALAAGEMAAVDRAAVHGVERAGASSGGSAGVLRGALFERSATVERGRGRGVISGSAGDS